ncbi:MAG: Stp1/IreP family PP2C-type Ser/Thr phosphatase [Clostridia bacterium]|nr:Stp1/IreP family PP2C-type Ser/Thr phosphatase [Clostridia bacterium]
MIAAARTHIGLVRKANEDSYLSQPENGLFAVADGMGGHKGGQTASQGAVNVLAEALRGRSPAPQQAEWAIQAANRRLYDKASQDKELEGMGTTVTLLWAAPKEMILAQVGDSRCYLLRNGQLTQMTRDHSLVEQLLMEGLITPEEAAHHPYRNVITRAVGTAMGVEVDVATHARQKGDVWLLCSDGLHGMVEKFTIEKILKEMDVDKAAQALLDAALENGGKDNITLLLLKDEEGAQ